MGIFDWWSRGKIIGTPGDDRLRDTYRSDQIESLGGNDRIILSYGDDQVNGGDGRDIVEIRGSLDEWEISVPQFFAPPPAGEHMIILTHPRYGEKTLTYVETVIDADGRALDIGRYFTTRIDGTDGDDDIVDTPGNDFISTHQGDDIVLLTTGNDFVSGGRGLDIIELQGRFSDYTQTWEDTGGNPIPPNALFTSERYGTKELDTSVEFVRDSTGEMIQLWPTSITGTEANDTLTDTFGDDYLYGQAGDDTLFLTTGEDRASGGDGEDTVHVAGSFDDYEISSEVFELNGITEIAVYMNSETYGDKRLSNVENIVSSDGDVIEVSSLLNDGDLFA